MREISTEYHHLTKLNIYLSRVVVEAAKETVLSAATAAAVLAVIETQH